MPPSANNPVAIGAYQPEHQRAIAASLGACLMVQRTYGRQGEDIRAMTAIFCRALQDYAPQEVVQALATWLSKSSEFPTPYDIRQLIAPQPVWSPVLFQELLDKRRRGDILSPREVDYVAAFKQHMMAGV